jgi:hypothetical protein
MATVQTTWKKHFRVFAFDIEARPGPWGGGDFTFRNMLSMAAGFEGKPVAYLAPGFLKYELERLIMPLREGNILVVGHNAIKYDLPMLNGTLVKLGRPPLGPLLVSDTYAHLVKSDYAYSKSLGNMAERFGIQAKGSMSEVQWERAYEGDPVYLERLKQYNIGDVLTVLALRKELLRRGILKPPRVWSP